MRKHKITLTDEDGVVIAQWTVEEEWGDVCKSIPRQLMAQEIADEVVKDTELNRQD